MPGNTPTNQTNETIISNYTYTGFSMNTFTENLGPNFGIDYTSGNVPVTFSSAFGVLFCGVTGIMTGANMSGKNNITFLYFVRQFEESFKKYTSRNLRWSSFYFHIVH